MLKKFFYLILFVIFSQNSYSHTSHYTDLNLLEFDLYRNNKLIGTHIFNFKRENGELTVKSKINFEIKKLGIVLYKYLAIGKEFYKDDKFVSFNSNTIQNKKKKFCQIDLIDGEYIIKGSSYNGPAPKEFIIGTWWNHSIIEKNNQISAISGRIIAQKVTFLGKEKMIINGKEYSALHFNFSSSDPKLSKKKKLNTDLWYDEKTLMWLKASFDKQGYWEYRLKNVN